MDKIKVVLVGAGNRGLTYTNIMHELPQQYQVVAVAEPVESRRNHIRDLHQIPDEMCFERFDQLFEKGKIADLAIISTQDRMHYAPAITAIELKYDILLEKPISPDAKECVEIMKAAQRNNVRVIICTVLRYTALFSTVKEIIDSGKIGNVVSVTHEECVGNIHQSHSYVRGNWCNTEKSSSMLLAKSCHDLDLIPWLLGKKCISVQSFGSLSHFTRKNAPAGAPERCIDGCPHGEACPYNAVRLYLDDKENYWFRSTSTMCQNPTDADVESALRNTQYGKCVYKCDNNVVDHQTVNMLFEDGITAMFSMCAFNKGGRFIHIMGTKGELHASLKGDGSIKIYDFMTQNETIIPMNAVDGVVGGHGGGDAGIVHSIYDYLTSNIRAKSIPTIEESCHHHILVFAAEASRLSGQVIDIEDFVNTL